MDLSVKSYSFVDTANKVKLVFLQFLTSAIFVTTFPIFAIMELALVWKCPVGVEEVRLPSLVSTLVQSGIKLFLHQRNQIPLPLEQLAQKRTTILERQLNKKDNEDNVHQSGQSKAPIDESDDTDAEEESDLKQHIQFMISKRRKDLNNLRRKRIAEKMSKREEFAVESITNCLEILDRKIQDNFPQIVAVGLFFGSSLYTAKEIILFDLSKIFHNLLIGCEGGKNNAGNLVSNLTRNFYKSIIMTDEFCDMTAKNLPSTRTHVCVLSSKELNLMTDEEEDNNNNSVLLDNVEIFTDYLCFDDDDDSTADQSGLAEDNDSASSPPFRNKNNKKKRKVLKITLDMKTNNSTDQQNLSGSIIRNTCNECLFCYQIPLRLKGIICKNTLK